MDKETDWKTFFDNHPKPARFEENVQRMQALCHQSTISKSRVALITVNLIIKLK